MSTDVELSVIVPCHDEAATLGSQLDALVSQTWSGTWEVIVVDNGSTDATPDIARAYEDRGVRLVDAPHGRGIAYARNRGVEAARGRSVAFCDGDDVVAPGWVAALGDALREHEFVTGTIDTIHLNPTDIATSRPASRNQARPMFGRIPFGRGNNCGIRRELCVDVGMFDESFRGLEDIEFSLRLAGRGIEPVLAPDAVVHYRFRADPADVWPQGRYYGRGRPELARRAAAWGLPGPPRWEGLRSWAWLVVNLPAVRTRSGRLRWWWVLANRIGVLEGAVRDRRLHV